MSKLKYKDKVQFLFPIEKKGLVHFKGVIESFVEKDGINYAWVFVKGTFEEKEYCNSFQVPMFNLWKSD